MSNSKPFLRFKRECQRLIDKLGLKGWRITYRLDHIPDSNGDCRANIDGRVATIRFSKQAERPPEEVARHEVLELFFSRIECLARSRYVSADEIGEEKHALIRALEDHL